SPVITSILCTRHSLNIGLCLCLIDEVSGLNGGYYNLGMVLVNHIILIQVYLQGGMLFHRELNLIRL
ncbi:hypothetical protein BV924_21180, partial [Pectobacterium odoriferum]